MAEAHLPGRVLAPVHFGPYSLRPFSVCAANQRGVAQMMIVLAGSYVPSDVPCRNFMLEVVWEFVVIRELSLLQTVSKIDLGDTHDVVGMNLSLGSGESAHDGG